MGTNADPSTHAALRQRLPQFFPSSLQGPSPIGSIDFDQTSSIQAESIDTEINRLEETLREKKRYKRTVEKMRDLVDLTITDLAIKELPLSLYIELLSQEYNSRKPDVPK